MVARALALQFAVVRADWSVRPLAPWQLSGSVLKPRSCEIHGILTETTDTQALQAATLLLGSWQTRQLTRASSVEFGRLIAQARDGDDAARGAMWTRYREYLALLARLNLGPAMRTKVSCSDVVQETFLQADKQVARFRGTTERELMAWLRRILATQIAQQVRFHRRERRDVGLERRLADDIDRSSAGLGALLVDPATSPSGRAVRNEQEVLLADALAQLKPEHREVIILRNLEERSFDEIATRMGRSVAAVKSLWVRALAILRRVLRAPSAG